MYWRLRRYGKTAYSKKYRKDPSHNKIFNCREIKVEN